MPKPFLPIRVQSDIEQQKSWEGIETPSQLAQYLSGVLAVDPNDFTALQEVIQSSLQPSGDDAGKIWIKTEPPYGLGIPVGNQYQMIYQYPVNRPFLWAGNESSIPPYALRLTAEQLENFSLTAPNISSGSWIIINI